MNSIENVRVKITKRSNTIWATIKGRVQKKLISRQESVKDRDLCVRIDEKQRLDDLRLKLGSAPIHEREITIPKDLYLSWIREEKRRWNKRNEHIKKIRKHLLREERAWFKEQIEDISRIRVQIPATIREMNYDSWDCAPQAAKFWKRLINITVMDFLKHHGKPNRDEEEDYISAKKFLFEDDYEIQFCSDEELGTNKESWVTFEQLIDMIKEIESVLQGEEHQSSPSIKSVRYQIALMSEDPELINKYK